MFSHENNDPLFLYLESLKKTKTPWTEYFLSTITRFMSDEELYTDCLQENLSILKPSLLNASLPKSIIEELYLEKRTEREETNQKNKKYTEQAENYREEIAELERLYKNLRADPNVQLKFEEIRILSTKIHDLKSAKEKVIEEKEKLNHYTKDIEYLKNAFHYYAPTPNSDAACHEATTALDAFLILKVCPKRQRSDELFSIYEGLNHLAAAREELLSKWDKLLSRNDYIEYIQKQKNLGGTYNKTALSPPSLSELMLFKQNKPAALIQKKRQLETYLNLELPVGEKLLLKFKEIIEKDIKHLKKTKPINPNVMQKDEQILQDLKIAHACLLQERKFLKQLSELNKSVKSSPALTK